jgi:hypothetical protein
LDYTEIQVRDSFNNGETVAIIRTADDAEESSWDRRGGWT